MPFRHSLGFPVNRDYQGVEQDLEGSGIGIVSTEEEENKEVWKDRG